MQRQVFSRTVTGTQPSGLWTVFDIKLCDDIWRWSEATWAV